MPSPLSVLDLVAFDETGNTGQNLLDPAQPVFVLAAVHVDDDTARGLLAHTARTGAIEAKFSALRGSSAGRRKLLAFFNDERISDELVKLGVYHKSFLVTTKIVDLLIEPLAYRNGINLYDRGANLALANLIHVVTPVFCGAAEFAELQRRFVALVRRPSAEAIASFYAQVERLRDTSRDADFRSTLGMLAATQAIVTEAIAPFDPVAIDPAVPTFIDLAAQWTHTLQVSFEIVHDRSKPIEHHQEVLERLMSFAKPSREFKGAGRNWTLPILATGVRFADSHSVPQLQVADLLSGATAAVLGQVLRRTKDGFLVELAATRLGELSHSPVWPSTADPSVIANEERDASASLDFTIELLRTGARSP
ncbi:hypothetical protein PLCT1_00345 [Planctomycetaceae bacterium]|nr:hypothetical protein PLCT1_00345 [Planctomycetaceae bacterium]